ncbi:hypothetical protein N9S91_00770 [Candidatus Pelagibacter sp.]|jgi:hypothetical protein|nr:hypothetical protein [Candidatus Pelagibacter sp.]
MKKLLGIIILGLLLVSCSEKEEKYFSNCVKDGKKFTPYSEDNILEYCQLHKQNTLDEFKYYKGKIFSRNSKDALTPDEKSKMWDKILKKVNKKKK